METVQIEANEISQHPDIIRGYYKHFIRIAIVFLYLRF